MILKTLIIGVIFTSGIFAVKSGIGVSYMWQKNKKKNIFFIFCAYFIIFILNFYLIKYFDFIKHFQIFQSLLKKGIFIHFILACGMFFWGLNVLISNKRDTKAYFLLALPCPFCFIVILLSIAFLYKFVGDYSLKYTLYFYLCFLFLQTISAMLFNFFKIKPETLLGMSLIIIGIYFLLTYLVAPVFSDIDRIYRIASYGYSNGWEFYKKNIYFFIAFILIAFSGFWKYKLKKRME